MTIFDVVEQDDRPWIVMELVPSQSLDQRIRSRGPLPPNEAAAIGLRILDALVTAQAAGVQHRDIKPANVLLADDGRVVLTDFGIARHTGDETLTSAGLLVGSPNFLAPERARGLQSPGMQSDLWSLGATLYAAVEGQPPFERNGPLPTLAAVVMDEPPPPERSGPLRPVIDGLLVKNPAYRLDADRTRSMLQRVLRPGLTASGPRATSTAAPVTAAPPDPTRPLPQVGTAGVVDHGATVAVPPSDTPDAGPPAPAAPPADSASTGHAAAGSSATVDAPADSVTAAEGPPPPAAPDSGTAAGGPAVTPVETPAGGGAARADSAEPTARRSAGPVAAEAPADQPRDDRGHDPSRDRQRDRGAATRPFRRRPRARLDGRGATAAATAAAADSRTAAVSPTRRADSLTEADSGTEADGRTSAAAGPGPTRGHEAAARRDRG